MDINKVLEVNGVYDNRNELLMAIANKLDLVMIKDIAICGTTNILTNKENTIKLDIKASKKDDRFIVKQILIREYSNGFNNGFTNGMVYKLKKGTYVLD